MKIRKATSDWPPWRKLNSSACFKALIVSVPELASPITSAPDAWALKRNDEKSVVANGYRTEPFTEPPCPTMQDVASDWRASPNAKFAVRKYQLFAPRFIMADAVACA